MNFQDYQKLASRTLPEGTKKELLSNFAFGIAGESGEVVDIIKKHIYHGHPLEEETLDNLIGELGDLLWYISQLAEVLDIDLTTVAYGNIQKLKKRYPNKGFSIEDSIKRVDIND